MYVSLYELTNDSSLDSLSPRLGHLLTESQQDVQNQAIISSLPGSSSSSLPPANPEVLISVSEPAPSRETQSKEKSRVSNGKKSDLKKNPSAIVGSPSASSKIPAGLEGADPIERLKYLESKIQEIEETYSCGICMERTRNVVFLCGHGACVVCAQTLYTCHMCREPIARKINIY